MASSLGELFVELGVFADTKELEQFEKKLKKVAKTVKETQTKSEKLNTNVKDLQRGFRNFALALSGAFYAINKLTDSLVQSNQEFLNMIRNSDIALGTFQKWDNVGRMFGVKNAAQQLASLNQRLYELKLTGQGAEGFILAGINPLGANAENVLEQLRNRVSGLDDTSATFLLSRMGLDPSMLHLLRMTREEFEAFNQQTSRYRLTEAQAKQIQAMNAQLEIARIQLQYFKDRAVIAIMPHLVNFMRVISGIVEKISELVTWLNSDNEFAQFIKFILKAVGIFTLWVFTVGKLAKVFELLSLAITGARVALLALTSHPIIAAITALAGLLMLAINHYHKQGAGGVDLIPNMGQLSQSVDNRRYFNSVRNNNPQITMNNTINTSQTAQAVRNELAYYQYYTYGFAQ